MKAIKLAHKVNDPYGEVEARTVAGVCYHRLGEPGQSQLHLSTGLAAAERLHDRFWLGRCLFRSQNLAFALGDWAGAREFGDRGLAADETHPRLLGALARHEYEMGDVEQGRHT